MDSFMEIPDSCELCHNSTSVNTADCVCEGIPYQYLTNFSDILYIFFTAEYLARIILFSPLPASAGGSRSSYLAQFFYFVFDPWQLIDLLSVLPFWLEFLVDMRTFSAVRILRLSRIFQVVKLGKNSKTFITFGRVMKRSTPALKLLAVILFFGMLIFGSLIYECERGNWKFTTSLTDPPSWQFIRLSSDGVTEEITPFTSIPASYWWFIVTATTVGYGDMVPTTMGGKAISGLAIVLSLLVVAFPVSVFTNLWTEEFGEISSSGNAGELGGGHAVVGGAGIDESFGFSNSSVGVKMVGGGGVSGVGSRVTFGSDVMDAVAMSRPEERSQEEVKEEIRRLLRVIEEARGEIERLTRSM